MLCHGCLRRERKALSKHRLYTKGNYCFLTYKRSTCHVKIHRPLSNTMTPAWSYFMTHKTGGFMPAHIVATWNYKPSPKILGFPACQEDRTVWHHSSLSTSCDWLICLFWSVLAFSTCHTHSLIHTLVNSAGDYSAVTTCQMLFKALSNDRSPCSQGTYHSRAARGDRCPWIKLNCEEHGDAGREQSPIHMRWSWLGFVKRSHFSRDLMQEKDVSSADTYRKRELHRLAVARLGVESVTEIQGPSV